MSAITKSITDALKKSNLGGSKELAPGSTPRRFEPNEGTRSLEKRIHRESKYTDDHKKMPFSFSKPKKAQSQKIVRCKNCGEIYQVNKNCVGITCTACKQYSGVEEIDE